MPLRDNERINTIGAGSTHNRADIMWVSNLIENQNNASQSLYICNISVR